MKTNLFIILIVLLLTSCTGENIITSEPIRPPNVLSMNYSQSKYSFQKTYDQLQSIIDTNPNIKTIAEVNHTQNAVAVDLELRPTQIIIFGNPKLGTPLMQQNPLVGLDLPQKMLVYQNEFEEVFIGYNATEYLYARYGLDSVSTLSTMANALAQLTTTVSGTAVRMGSDLPTLEEGVITKTSTKSFEDTYTSLQTEITNNPNLRILAEVNHTANANRIGKDLNPIRLLIFGNPNLGTPLMQSAQTTALDLPQKMLVWEDDAHQVHVSYNDPQFLVQRHDIKGHSEVIQTISGALDKLSTLATN